MEIFETVISSILSAGGTQGHITTNAFNILSNKGFLRDEGILSLESVQEFYKTIGDDEKNFSLRVANLLDFCNRTGRHELDYQPVITLVKISSRTGEVQGHAVVLKHYRRYDDILHMTTFDSTSDTGQTMVECPIVIENGQQKLKVRASKDELCLGSETCYVFYFD